MPERSLQAYYPELARIGAETRIEAGGILWRQLLVMRRAAAVLMAVWGLFAGAAAAEIPSAAVILEVLVPTLPGQVALAAPPRFVLMEDGTLYVGGTRGLMVGKLEPSELKDLERRVADVRKLPLTGVMTVGPGKERRHLFLKKGRPLDMVLSGDPADPPARVRALAALVTDLARFQHPSLRPYEPASFAMSAKESALSGGCRPWTLPESLAESVFAPRIVPAKGHGDWPTGAVPASVCLDDKRYVVTFRPLLPGERP